MSSGGESFFNRARGFSHLISASSAWRSLIDSGVTLDGGADVPAYVGRGGGGGGPEEFCNVWGGGTAPTRPGIEGGSVLEPVFEFTGGIMTCWGYPGGGTFTSSAGAIIYGGPPIAISNIWRFSAIVIKFGLGAGVDTPDIIVGATPSFTSSFRTALTDRSPSISSSIISLCWTRACENVCFATPVDF